MKNITTLVVRNEKFHIVKNEEGFYLAINSKYVDKDMKLTQALNGLQMHASKDLNTCITNARNAVEVRYLIEQGMDEIQAVRTVVLGA